MLKFNNARFPTDISIRDAVAGRFRSFPSCLDLCTSQCAGDAACLERLKGPLGSSGCEALANCGADVGAYQARFCLDLEQRDPRDLCDAVEVAPSGVADELLASLRTYCGAVRGQAAALEPGEALPDDCHRATLVQQRTAADEIPLVAAARNSRAASAALGIPPPSDYCECQLAAALTADAECRQLACVVGQADDRLETELFESYSDAEAAFANRRDLCGARAVAAGCDAEDLVGIGTDEEPN